MQAPALWDSERLAATRTRAERPGRGAARGDSEWGRSKQKQVLERVSSIGARLAKKPESVEDYVRLISFLVEELEKQQELAVGAHRCTRIHART